MNIALGCDEAGFDLKQIITAKLKELGHSIEDYGCYDKNPVLYPDIGRKVAEAIAAGKHERGILICGTGIGMSMMANKVKGIRASLVSDLFSAEMTRAHNNANVLCMGARIISEYMAWEFTKVWLSTEHLGGKYAKRVEAMMNYEKNR